MLNFFIRLLLANLIGDFLFQPSFLVKKKRENQNYIYLHIIIYAISLLLVLKFDFSYWPGIIILICSHFIIDFVKMKLTGKANERWLFFADQLLHLLFIGIVVYIYYPFKISIDLFYSETAILLFTTLVFITSGTSVITKTVMSRWDIEEEDSLEKAGVYIGILERLFIFGFIVLNYWAGIGFLLAAKSVFRFGDLSKAKDRKLTEYVLIGTLFSFGIAIISCLAYQYLAGLLKQ
ncbi:MAG: DUF3307 domain-containing protein [Bacteroidales bacterium]|nr:DUF3307 domain-containing protein [Bacteroidales bacterium]